MVCGKQCVDYFYFYFFDYVRTFTSFLGVEIEREFVFIVVLIIVLICVQLYVKIQYGPVVLQRSLTCWWSLKTECLLIHRPCQIVSSASIAFSRRTSSRYDSGYNNISQI